MGELNSANLWMILDLDRVTGRTQTFGFPLFQIVYLDLHCLFGFRLDLHYMFGFSLDFDLMGFEILFVWFCFICLESLGPKGEC